jgi:hypothetical protein
MQSLLMADYWKTELDSAKMRSGSIPVGSEGNVLVPDYVEPAAGPPQLTPDSHLDHLLPVASDLLSPSILCDPSFPRTIHVPASKE